MTDSTTSGNGPSSQLIGLQPPRSEKRIEAAANVARRSLTRLLTALGLPHPAAVVTATDIVNGAIRAVESRRT